MQQWWLIYLDERGPSCESHAYCPRYLSENMVFEPIVEREPVTEVVCCQF
jgi:hypothetical protein